MNLKFLLVAFSQDSLDSGATLEESSGMDLDAEAVRDAENNINTARWAGLIISFQSIYSVHCRFISRIS